MASPTKQPPHIFTKSLLGVVTILVLGFGILQRGQAHKNEFDSLTAPITAIGPSFPGATTQHPDETRYVQAGRYPQVFELFIGHGFTDFSPALEKVDSLKPGDIVTVYFRKEASQAADAANVNRQAQFIDKDGKPYYIRGRKDRLGGYGLIAAGLLIGLTLVVLRQKGTIA